MTLNAFRWEEYDYILYCVLVAAWLCSLFSLIRHSETGKAVEHLQITGSLINKVNYTKPRGQVSTGRTPINFTCFLLSLTTVASWGLIGIAKWIKNCLCLSSQRELPKLDLHVHSDCQKASSFLTLGRMLLISLCKSGALSVSWRVIGGYYVLKGGLFLCL